MKYITIIMMMLVLASMGLAVAEEPAFTVQTVSDYHATLVAGKYFPYGNNTLPAEGTEVLLECRQDEFDNEAFQTNTSLGADGTFNIVMLAADCIVGDEVQACIGAECSGYETVLATSTGGWGEVITDIIGTPEYTTLGAGLLVLLTGGSIAFLRRKKF